MLFHCLSAMLVVAAVSTAQNKSTIEHYTAMSANVTGAPDVVKIDLLRWSTDAEREQLLTALSGKGIKEFSAALAKAPTLGYIWTSESAGYSLRYAWRMSAPDGGLRVIVATDKALGAWNPQIWKPLGTAKGNDYDFTVLEMRMKGKLPGEGKSSLFAKITVDNSAKTIALDNYAASPIVLKDCRPGL